MLCCVQTYDVNNQLACLEAVWVSKAAARQRKGRAGRLAVCITYTFRTTFNALLRLMYIVGYK